MDHLYRIAFLMLFLTGCLQGKPVNNRKTPVQVGINHLLNGITCPGSVFYTPAEVETNCISAALACSIKELNIVRIECLDNSTNPENMEHHINMTAQALRAMIDNEKTTTDTSECRICEDPKLEKSFNDFMQNIRHLAEALTERLG